jgi:hypothetical protein
MLEWRECAGDDGLGGKSISELKLRSKFRAIVIYMPKPIPKSPALCNKEMNELKQSREDAAQHLYLPIETGEVQKGSLSIYMPTFIHSVHGGMEGNDS